MNRDGIRIHNFSHPHFVLAGRRAALYKISFRRMDSNAPGDDQELLVPKCFSRYPSFLAARDSDPTLSTPKNPKMKFI